MQDNIPRSRECWGRKQTSAEKVNWENYAILGFTLKTLIGSEILMFYQRAPSVTMSFHCRFESSFTARWTVKDVFFEDVHLICDIYHPLKVTQYLLRCSTLTARASPKLGNIKQSRHHSHSLCQHQQSFLLLQSWSQRDIKRVYRKVRHLPWRFPATGIVFKSYLCDFTTEMKNLS